MRTYMLATKMLVGMTVLIVAMAWIPSGSAASGLARSDDGGCYLVEWTTSTVIAPATGCSSNSPCVHINWTTTPPQAAIIDC